MVFQVLNLMWKFNVLTDWPIHVYYLFHEITIHHNVSFDVGDKNRLDQRVSHDSPETREETLNMLLPLLVIATTILHGTSFILSRMVLVLG